MELPDLGSQCSVSDCKQLDFLPFTCSQCGLVFCDHHHLAHNHACQGTASIAHGPSLPPRAYPCSSAGCGETSPIEMNCVSCARHFCLKHRHHGCLEQTYTESEKRKWEEPKKCFAAAKAQVDREVEATLKSASQKSNKTALKVNLMRLKSKAVGPKTIPPEDRAYFFVNPPASSGQSGKAAYVSSHWPLGRVVDAFADALSVANSNNRPGAAKLALLREAAEVSTDMAVTLKKLIESGQLVEGETVSLEFVSK